MGLEEYFHSGGITAIEWADKIPSLLPKEILWINILYREKYSVHRNHRKRKTIRRIRVSELVQAKNLS